VRRAYTAVLERQETFAEDFETEPYEAAWASEARWFVRVLDLREGTTLRCVPQISPDGLVWCDEGNHHLSIDAPGLYSLALRDFGHWLRLRCDLNGGNAAAKILIYLALKE
jgi:hypothetical protein